MNEAKHSVGMRRMVKRNTVSCFGISPRGLAAALFAAMVVLACFIATPLTAAAEDDYPPEYRDEEYDTIVDPWWFYNRECTSFVAWRLYSRGGVEFTNHFGDLLWGDAVNWGPIAERLGFVVDMNPAPGAVAWNLDGENGAGEYGHVAWVASVDGDKVTIEEYNVGDEKGLYNTRTVDKGEFGGYIHIADLTKGGQPGDAKRVEETPARNAEPARNTEPPEVEYEDVTKDFAGKRVALRSVRTGWYICGARSSTVHADGGCGDDSKGLYQTELTKDGWLTFRLSGGDELLGVRNRGYLRNAAGDAGKEEHFRIYKNGYDYYLFSRKTGSFIQTVAVGRYTRLLRASHINTAAVTASGMDPDPATHTDLPLAANLPDGYVGASARFIIEEVV